MNWGKSIVVVFVLFACLIFTMVYISMQYDVNLVAPNYYEEELAYQDQIDRIKNFNNLKSKPTIERVGNQIILVFPSAVAKQMENGEILFFRPADHKVDKKVIIQLDSQFSQTFNTSTFGKGLWRAKLKWTSGNQEFFSEQRIVL